MSAPESHFKGSVEQTFALAKVQHPESDSRPRDGGWPDNKLIEAPVGFVNADEERRFHAMPTPALERFVIELLARYQLRDTNEKPPQDVQEHFCAGGYPGVGKSVPLSFHLEAGTGRFVSWRIEGNTLTQLVLRKPEPGEPQGTGHICEIDSTTLDIFLVKRDQGTSGDQG